jgi:hypothetical protein
MPVVINQDGSLKLVKKYKALIIGHMRRKFLSLEKKKKRKTLYRIGLIRGKKQRLKLLKTLR